ncbi:MAG: hypothetical protein ABSG75_08200 [Syntrophales bacterium]
MHGSAEGVADRITALAAPFAYVSASDRWMPQGFDDIKEAQLNRAPRLIDPEISEQLTAWWLAPASRRSRTPNFDIASSCMIEGKPGLLLIEAKAHDEELNKEVNGRKLAFNSSHDRKASHETIAAAIANAREGLEKATSLRWFISRDSHYQMSNRFAWAWKLTEFGIPIILVYLGFLKAEEMVDQGKPFANYSEWEQLVKAHSESLFPYDVWGQRWVVNGQPFIPLIQSIEQPLTFEEART